MVALADPADLMLLDELAFATGLEIRPMLASETDLDDAIARHLGASWRAGRGPLQAIDLPEDTSPLSAGARRRGGRLLH